MQKFNKKGPHCTQKSIFALPIDISKKDESQHCSPKLLDLYPKVMMCETLKSTFYQLFQSQNLGENSRILGHLHFRSLFPKNYQI